jgi:rhodanese-related sulfurtransferase
MDNEIPPEIDVHTFDEMRRTGTPLAILDVREAGEIAICSFENSINIPMNLIPDSLDELPGESPLVVICHSGMRSQQVTIWLRQMGYENAANLQGGIDAWARQVDRSMPVY